MKITVDNLIFKTVTGKHLPGKDNSDIRWLAVSHPPNEKSNIKYIPSGISDVLPNIDGLFFPGALLTKLFRRNFKGMSTVEAIDLSNNFIDYIEEDTFYEVPNLKSLSIQENRLTTIPSKLFMHSTELKFILLRKNNIREFDGECLRNCLLLEEIYLKENLLTKIKINFSNFTEINTVDLENNVCVNASSSIHYKNSISLNDLQSLIDTNC